MNDYKIPITDKLTLLKAIFFELRLIDVYSFNWDAIEEGFQEISKLYALHKGIIIIMNINNQNLLKEVEVLIAIINDFNSINGNKVKLILNTNI